MRLTHLLPDAIQLTIIRRTRFQADEKVTKNKQWYK